MIERPEIGDLVVFEAAYCDDECQCVELVLGIVSKHHDWGGWAAETIESTGWIGSADHPDYPQSEEYRKAWKRLHRIKGIMERRGVYNLVRSEKRRQYA